MNPDISLILPAYNEARVIPVTVGEAVQYFVSRGLSYEIIVAADGSDGTREIVRKMGRENPALQAIGSDARRGISPPLPAGDEIVRQAPAKLLGNQMASGKGSRIGQYRRIPCAE